MEHYEYYGDVIVGIDENIIEKDDIDWLIKFLRKVNDLQMNQKN